MPGPNDEIKQKVYSEKEENQADKMEVINSGTEATSDNSEKSTNLENKLVKLVKSVLPTFVIAIGSFILVFLLHYFGAFNGFELQLYDLRMKLRGPISGIDSKSALPNAEDFVDLTEPFIDSNKNGTWDDGEIFNDLNGNRNYDEDETFIDVGNGVWDEVENFVDLDGNGVYDEWDEYEDKGNGKWDSAEKYTDINNNGIWDGENKIYDVGIDSISTTGVGCWVEESCANGVFDPDEDFTDKGNGKWDQVEPFEDNNNNDIWDDAEPFRDDNGDGKWNIPEPIMDNNGNGAWDDSEVFTDINGNGKWDMAEDFTDDNENGIWDEGEELFDMGNETWDEGEEFTDIDECEKTGTVCRNQQCVEYKECHDINQNNKWDKGLDVILVEIDDESFRLINEPMPYSRGTIWSRAVKNLTDAGAKVIAIDMVFDKPDHQTENIKNYIKEQKVTGITVEEGDKLLVEAINYANSQGTKVILSGVQKIEPSRFPPDYLLEPTKGLMEKDNNQRFGLVNISVDLDNFYRKYGIFYPISGHESVYYTLGINTVLSYFNVDEKPEFILDAEKGIVHVGPLAIPFYGNMPNEFLLNYSGPASGEYKTFNRYSLSNIVDTEDYYIGESEYDPDFGEIFYFEDQNWMDNIIGPNAAIMAEAGFINPFKGKIVVIGTSLAEDQDIKPTPYLTYGEKDHLMPGLEIHANAIQQMLYSNYIDLPFGGLEYNNNVSKYKNIHLVLILVLIIITLLFVSKAPPLWGFAVMAIEVIAWGSYSIGAFLTDQLWLYKLIAGQELNLPGIGESAMIPVLFPVSAIVLPFGINLTYKLFSEGQDKAFLKAAFGNYISPELIDEMFESKQKPSLGGDNGMRTAYFTDIASFSTFSEKLTATRLVELLNEYLTKMTEILLEEGGTLDKYEGDAIIAFLGAPVEQPDNALRGLRAAVRMQEGCEELRIKWTEEGDKWPDVVKQMRTRIGINHGDLVNGNMGSKGRMNYTMMGDTVNTAARLEEGAKQYGIYTATTYETLEVAGKDEFEWRIVDKTCYMGKSEATTTVEILGSKGGISDDLMNAIAIFNEGFELYQQMNWDGAIAKFTESEKYEEEFIGRPTTPSKKLIERCEEYKEEPPVPDDEEWDGVFTMTKK